VYDITPSNWYLGLQVLHAAKCAYEASRNLTRLEPYLYHLIPLKNWVNASVPISLMYPEGFSERGLLLSIWDILQVGLSDRGTALMITAEIEKVVAPAAGFHRCEGTCHSGLHKTDVQKLWAHTVSEYQII
jgi:hypothetical protein